MTVKTLCLLGPTGAGKTRLALALAERFGGAVVNFDSRQVYDLVPIITAQPTPEEAARCPHLLYGFLDCSQAVSAGIYVRMARQALDDVRARGLVPILVGGTGLYLRSLLGGLAEIPPVPEALRQELTAQLAQDGPGAMHARLAEVDPEFAAKIHPNDRQRALRGLEVFLATGKPLSFWHKANGSGESGIQCLKIGLRLEKAFHERCLTRRIEAMLAAGALDEMRRALALHPGPDAPGLSGIGCVELAAHLRGELDLHQACELWFKNTKAYAKRQLTWFAREEGVRWLAPDDQAQALALAERWLAAPTPGRP